MKEELDKLYEEMSKEVDRININDSGLLNDKANKPYWDIERKYKKKAKEIRYIYIDAKK